LNDSDTRSQNSTMPLIYQLASIGLLLSLISHVAQSGSPDSQQLSSQCQACSAIAAAFQRGLERTARDNFGGGNTNWEETRLGTYALSETRLVDITDRLCKDKDNEMNGVTSSECHAMLEKIEEDIEKFWFGAFKANPTSASLRDSVCVNGTAACCAYGRWDRSARPAPTAPAAAATAMGTGLGPALAHATVTRATQVLSAQTAQPNTTAPTARATANAKPAARLVEAPAPVRWPPSAISAPTATRQSSKLTEPRVLISTNARPAVRAVGRGASARTCPAATGAATVTGPAPPAPDPARPAAPPVRQDSNPRPPGPVVKT
ncbi:hypothetical protein BOX15_Mlig018256g1, partial [Macrostomum lignano]